MTDRIFILDHLGRVCGTLARADWVSGRMSDAFDVERHPNDPGVGGLVLGAQVVWVDGDGFPRAVMLPDTAPFGVGLTGRAVARRAGSPYFEQLQRNLRGRERIPPPEAREPTWWTSRSRDLRGRVAFCATVIDAGPYMAIATTQHGGQIQTHTVVPGREPMREVVRLQRGDEIIIAAIEGERLDAPGTVVARVCDVQLPGVPEVPRDPWAAFERGYSQPRTPLVVEARPDRPGLPPGATPVTVGQIGVSAWVVFDLATGRFDVFARRVSLYDSARCGVLPVRQIGQVSTFAVGQADGLRRAVETLVDQASALGRL